MDSGKANPVNFSVESNHMIFIIIITIFIITDKAIQLMYTNDDINNSMTRQYDTGIHHVMKTVPSNNL